jgi:NhaA family Na+:H+ antiporter
VPDHEAQPRRALRGFLAAEAAGGVLLVAAAVVALIWANVAGGSQTRLFATDLGPLDLHGWVNEGLMALFFLVVGLEISRELTVGELRRPKAAALPVLAALGGMAVPALVYLAVNPTGPGARGWGIPMATDIAFAAGVVALLGRRVPSSIRLFLLALAIVDDLGAIIVIAVAYSQRVHLAWLLAAGIAVTAVWLARGHPAALATLGPLAWWCTHESGVHAAIAGVALGFAVPSARDERYERLLHPITTYLVVPLFALANVDVRLSTGAPTGAAGRVAAGVAVGLVLGKLVGVAGAGWLAVRLRLAVLPDGATFAHLVGAAAVAGIGFTVSLFVTELALQDEPTLVAGAKIAILAASVVAAAVGTLVFGVLGRRM